MTTINHTKLWEKCKSIIKDNISTEEYNQWFAPIVPVKYEKNEEKNEFTIQLPSRFYYTQIERTYSKLIRETLKRETGESVKLMYIIPLEELESHIPGGTTSVPTPTPNDFIKKAYNTPTTPRPMGNIDSHLNINLSFDDFVQGKENKMAHVAGVSIGNTPGKTVFNPLFIYGNPGVGKTHLANAIGLMVKDLHPEKNVLYVSAHVFSQQFSQATMENKTNDFMNFYQHIDVLIIDDIHEFATKKKTQGIFFNIFNYLHQSGKQLILTSDRMPEQLEGFEDRLLSRFRGGLSARIEEPGVELRKAILRKKIEKDDLHIPEDVVEYIAEHTGDTRALEGAISKLLLFSIVNGNQAIDLSLAMEVLGNSATEQKPKAITVEFIRNTVCEHLNLPVDEVLSKDRRHELVLARQLAMYLSKQHTQQSLSNIGLHIGRRDHATVLHACKVISDQLDWDKNLRLVIKELEAKIMA
ncbi:MAG: chromosomal replication initiator protein DnaA [Bacteroidales bacterium]|nr:chromosomal replication initiator protein DnaA [Bacteroidales bacterium]MBR6311033.1 chromosomal replication initiator protein DnaA [Paludibacteraceae bacterium]